MSKSDWRGWPVGTRLTYVSDDPIDSFVFHGTVVEAHPRGRNAFLIADIDEIGGTVVIDHDTASAFHRDYAAPFGKSEV